MSCTVGTRRRRTSLDHESRSSALNHRLILPLLVLNAAALGLACREAEHAGEPATVLRLRVDTTPPGPGELPTLVSLGDSIFHGLVGGSRCGDCHLSRAQSAAAPRLDRSAWLRDQATFGSLIHFIAHGRRDPRQDVLGGSHNGGASLTPGHIRAVAAFLLSQRRPSSAD